MMSKHQDLKSLTLQYYTMLKMNTIASQSTLNYPSSRNKTANKTNYIRGYNNVVVCIYIIGQCKATKG